MTDEEKVEACQLAKLAGADFVKTSTGFSTGGATIEDIELMREAVGPYYTSQGIWWSKYTWRLKPLSELVQPVLVLRQEWP